MPKVFIIAEAGVNHNGSVDIAKKMIDAAKEAGADAIKFQTFKAERMTSRFAPKAEYQKKRVADAETQFEMLKMLELNVDAHKALMAYCDKKEITFLSSAFDTESIELLNGLGLEIFKIPSSEITNLLYLRKIGVLRKKLILSSGMADLKEIGEALRVLAKAGTPKEDITVLHCSTEYPAPYQNVNLRAMLTIRDAFKVKVGYSDHTLGIEVAVVAAALGASIIEKHFSLNKNMEGPDHKISVEPHELKAMVVAIRNIEESLGDGIKKPSDSEFRNMAIVRKSIVASKDIKKGEYFTEENITAKRPGSGMSPMRWDDVIKKRAKRDFKQDEAIEL